MLTMQLWRDDKPMNFPMLDALCPTVAELGRRIFASRNPLVAELEDQPHVPNNDPPSHVVPTGPNTAV